MMVLYWRKSHAGVKSIMANVRIFGDMVLPGKGITKARVV